MKNTRPVRGDSSLHSSVICDMLIPPQKGRQPVSRTGLSVGPVHSHDTAAAGLQSWRRVRV